MLKEKYLTYKLEYREYILLLKSGNFYISLNKDAIVINRILKYKIKESTNFIKTGFPITSLNKVLLKLDENEVNYIIVDKEIIFKQKHKKNNYNRYVTNYELNSSRINNVSKVLKENLSNEKLDRILLEIEKIVCQINY